MMGLSQMGRLSEEMNNRHGDKVKVIGSVRIEGENMAGKMEKALRDVQGNKEKVDVILIGGPVNSLVTHGKAVERGLGEEREVKVKQKDNVEEENGG